MKQLNQLTKGANGLLFPFALRIRRVVYFTMMQLVEGKRYLEYAAVSYRPKSANNAGNVRSQLMYFTHQIEKGLCYNNFKPELLKEPIHGIENDAAAWLAGGGSNSDEFFVNAQDALAAIDAKIEGENLDLTAGAVAVSTRDPHDPRFNPGQRTFLNVITERRSLREFGDQPVDDGKINAGIELAMTTPSACNRQATRVHVYSDNQQIKEILDIQGGVRGYATPPRLLAITSDLTCWFGGHEKNQAYVDAGLFAMELLLALEDQNLAACALNTMAFSRKERKLRQACAIPNNEVFAMLIAVGPPPSGILTPISYRQSGTTITQWH